jgi:hypothetical protein
VTEDEEYLVYVIQELCRRIDDTNDLSQTNTFNRVQVYDDSYVLRLIRDLRTYVDNQIYNLRNVISVSAAGSDVFADLIIERTPTTIWTEIDYSYEIQRRIRILFIWGQPEPFHTPSRNDECHESYVSQQTPARLKIRREVLPLKVGIPVHVANVSGMSVANWNAISAGITIGTFPYSILQIDELPETSATALLNDPPSVPTLSDFQLSYLRTSAGGSLGNTLVNLAVTMLDAIPQTLGAAGALASFISGLTAITSIFQDSSVYAGELPPTQPFSLEWSVDNDTAVYTSVTRFVSADGQINSENEPDRAFQTKLSTTTGTTINAPWVDNISASFLGESECRMRAQFIADAGYCEWDDAVMQSQIPETGVGVPGLSNGNVQYRLLLGLNRPEEIAKDGSAVTGWNTIFIDGRPYAYFDGVDWHERPELVQPSL